MTDKNYFYLYLIALLALLWHIWTSDQVNKLQTKVTNLQAEVNVLELKVREAQQGTGIILDGKPTVTITGNRIVDPQDGK